MQSLRVVPLDDPRDHVPGLEQVRQFLAVQGFPQRAVTSLNDPVLFGAVRPDPLMPESVFVQYSAELPRDVETIRGIPPRGISPPFSLRSRSIAACASTLTVIPSVLGTGA